jgi:hypothetical protein
MNWETGPSHDDPDSKRIEIKDDIMKVVSNALFMDRAAVQ